MISENNNIIYGTPLPEKEDEELTLNPTALYHQKVTDSQGRQRFHGAFTGGFSAGYYNTVGSKGGWVPSSFVSSRKRKAELRDHIPENFMDEEDLGEFGIAPRRVTASNEYNESRHKMGKNSGDWFLNELTTLCSYEGSHVLGVRLLKSLGWREGKGIGAKIKRELDFGGSELYGCQPRVKSELKVHDFDPPDVPTIDFVVKDNVFGLGYSGIVGFGLSNPRKTETKSRLGYNNENYLSSKGQAFGVGVFEADDGDIYSREDMDNYDVDIGDDDDRLNGWTAPLNVKTYAGVIEGFALSEHKIIKHFFPPIIFPPKDYKAPKISRFDDVDERGSSSVRKSRFSHNPITRAEILDEPIVEDKDTNKFVKFGKSKLLSDIIEAEENGSTLADEKFPSTRWKDAKRTVSQWVPDNLVCKRFNVPNPYPDLAASDAKMLGEHKIFADLIPPKVDKSVNKREKIADRKAVNIFSHLFEAANNTGVINIPDESEEYKIIKEPFINDLNDKPLDLFNEIFGESEDELAEESPMLSPIDIKPEFIDLGGNMAYEEYSMELKPCKEEESDESSHSYFGPALPVVASTRGREHCRKHKKDKHRSKH